MESKNHAPLSALRGAIRDFRVIRFTYEGKQYVVEPAELGRSSRGSMELTGWVREGPHASGLWLKFHYWKIRELQILPDHFTPPPKAAPTPDLIAKAS